jgi:hypothetical protein
MANSKRKPVKLRIRQNNNIFGEWWTCYSPIREGEFLKLIGSGKTPQEAYINYFNPISFQGGLSTSSTPKAQWQLQSYGDYTQ